MKLLRVLSVIMLLFVAACAMNRKNNVTDDTWEQARMLLEQGQQVKGQDNGIRSFEQVMDGKWIGQAVSYGPYRAGQAPGALSPTKEQILEDLQIIKEHWNLIRVYNADDVIQSILELIEDNQLPVKVMLGVWLENEQNNPRARQANIHNTLRGIQLANRFPGVVVALSVGNETQVFWSGHKLDQDLLIRYIRVSRRFVSQPVTTADDYNFWNKPESRRVASEIDFITTHIYPLWNGKNLAESIDWLDNNYRVIKELHADKEIILGEIGWATAYDPSKTGNGEQGSLIKGEVGLQAQETFLTILDQWTVENRVCTFLFEAFDEPWKGGGEHTGPTEVEKNWGVYYETRLPKPSFTNYLNNKQLQQ